jgi:hypothetical protein
MDKEERSFHFDIRSRRTKLALATMVVVIAIGAAIYGYHQAQQQELIQFLTEYHAYNPNFEYEALMEVNVDRLPKPNGNLTVQNLIITYAFNPADEYDSVPYLRLTYLSGPPCNVSQFPSSTNCHEILLIVPNNNVTNTSSPMRSGPSYVLYAGPLNSFIFDLQTDAGEHIEWHLYLFLMTYQGTDSGGS